MATSAFNKFDAFTFEMGKGTHDFSSHAFKVALTNTAPSAANTQLSDITQIAAGGGYTAGAGGGYALDGVTWSTSGGIAKLVVTDETITASGAMATFRYGVVYNDTSTGDKLIGWVDYGAGVTLGTGEQFILDFDATNGVFTVQ